MVRVRVRVKVRVRVRVGVGVGVRGRVRKVGVSAPTTALSAENCTSTILPKRLLLLLRVVLALPKASRMGLVPMILSDSAPG